MQAKGTNSVWVVNSPKASFERLKKKIFRWRRLLANVDPLIHFVVTHTSPTGSMVGSHALVFGKWNPLVMHFWSHLEINVLLQSTPLFEERFSEYKIVVRITIGDDFLKIIFVELYEEALQDFLREIPLQIDKDIEIHPPAIVISGEQRVDEEKMESIMNSDFTEIISAFIPSETVS
jgi:hypothetical protein